MPINLEVNGTEFTNFISIAVTLALDTLSNDFSITASFPDGEELPLKGGDPCALLIDDVLVMTGYIESITGTYNSGTHTIIASGRDKTADLIDSNIDVMDDLRAPISLKQIIEKVIAHIGADLKVIDNTSPEPFNKAEDIIAPQPGDNAFSFVEQYAQKRQVILTSNAEGNVVITNSDDVLSGGAVQNAIGAETNNVISASWAYLTSGLYNKYIQKGQLDPVALSFGGASSSDGVVSQEGAVVDSNVREGRQLVSVASTGFSEAQLKERAEWSKKIRQARSVTYSCDVQGFENSGGSIWAINTLVSVFDEFADINRELLLNSIQFFDSAQGALSILNFVEADAYKLKVSEPKAVGSNQDTFIL